jgi:YHS domain-containing protein
MSPTATYNFLSGATRTFSHNVFYNDSNQPSGESNIYDSNKLTSDPNLVNPGTDGNGLDAVDGYNLQSGSPCIDSGMNITNNGGLDYWGNDMPYNGITDRGFYEWPGTDPSSDTTAPRPNPMAFTTVPYQTGPTSIAMTAPAVDTSGVEYYFANTTIADHNSGWQASPTYTDTGLMPSTNYTYTVKARDLSENLNETAVSTPASATTAADTSPPLPNPITWAIAPHQVDSNSISMTATTATDATGVEYYFAIITGGGHDSGWQASSTYIDTGLSPGTYSYQIRAHDTSPAHNTGGWSSEQFATVEVSADTTPPSPDPMTWAIEPNATGTTSIAMTATTATDPCGVEYYFANTTIADHNSGWQAEPNYTDTGLSPSTSYTYTVKARDLSENHNETADSTPVSATTDIPGDVTKDGIVDWNDVRELAGQWLNTCSAPDWCGGCDIDESGRVDFVDFSKLAENWLSNI